MSSILALCADPGIALDRVKGASVHVRELWRALADSGAVVRGVAGVREPDRVPIVPGVLVQPVTITSHRRDEFAGEVATAARAFARRPPWPGPDWILERLALGSEAGAELAGEMGLPLVVEVDAPLDEEASRFRGTSVDGRTRERLERTLARADLVVCVSRALVPWVIARGGAEERTRVLPNGVRVEAFAGARPARAPNAPLRIAFVGSFKPWHGLDVLLDAVRELHDRGVAVELELVGDGPERAALEHRVRSENLGDRVRFLGLRPHAEIVEVLRRADVGVAPAPRDVPEYFSPLKVYEYAAAGCAVVASDSGQTGECFQDGFDALLVPPGDAGALARALVRLATQPRLRERLAEAARRRARAEFDWRHVASRLCAWADEVPRSRRSTA